MPWNSVTGKFDTDNMVETPQAVPEPQPDVEGFLKVIEEIESSGGKNFNHPEMQEGIHAGHAAMGRFGLMPNTIKEIEARARAEGRASDNMRRVAGLNDPMQMKVEIEANPEIEREFARQLAERVLKKFPDEQQAAYSWNQGHNLTPESVAKRKYQEHDYVKKFNKLKQLLLAGK